MTDHNADAIQSTDDATPVLVIISSSGAVSARELAVTPEGIAIDIDTWYEHIGTVAKGTMLRGGFDVKVWWATPLGGGDAVYGRTRQSAVDGMLALLRMRRVSTDATSSPLI